MPASGSKKEKKDKKDEGEKENVKEEEDIESYKKRKIADLENLGRSGGVYVPPFKLARMQKEIEDKTSAEYQRQTWEALRKSINGLVNKVNVGNIKNIVEELFQENLVRGRGLLVRALIRAQMASPGFTHVFAALLAVINSKLPEVGDLLIRRVILQFRRAYKRNDKIVTTAAIKFMAHLVNQKICSELLALHVSTLLLERVTEDSIEVCVSFLQEVGQAMEDLSKAGCQAIFERFRTILHEGEIDKRVQYVIEGLFETRRKKFSDHPMVLDELDLVEDEDQITHEVDLLDETIKGEETLNIFKAIPPETYAADEAKWKLIAGEILGLEQDEGSDSSEDSDEEADAAADRRAQEKILDFTEQDLVNLRRQIYLVIMSSVHYEECVHKILKLNIAEGQEKEVCTMLIDCCAMEKMFNRFFVLQAERLCRLNPVYQDNFTESFGVQFNTVHRLETNKLRNIGKFFAHLLYTDAIPWSIWAQVKITEETTTSSSRIFIKVIFQELSEQWGIKKLVDRLREEELKPFFVGLFPKDHPKNVRFAINYFTAIGLGVLTEDLRSFLEQANAQAAEDAQKAAAERAMEEESSSSSSSSSDSSDSDSDSDDDDSDDSDSSDSDSSSSDSD
ncbi:Pre-mRNA-splicing factor CWC22 [Durusdinium trenchii]|uniref:Pre-mRNA-splicing factor CWC22 n=1 Tax=Durusdinium trenchii TaxID=1381693 RepID=A0ABP0MBA8_9DINO